MTHSTYHSPFSKASLNLILYLQPSIWITDFGMYFLTLSRSFLLPPLPSPQFSVYILFMCMIAHYPEAQRFHVLSAANCFIDIGAFL